jgi:hypothetical protein
MTTRKKPSTGLQQARERAAGELNLPLSDHRVDRLAKLVIADEAMQSLLVVAPERVDFGKMLEVDQALAALRQELKPAAPLALKVSFVSGVVGMFKCQHCHKENRRGQGLTFGRSIPSRSDGGDLVAVIGTACRSRA